MRSCIGNFNLFDFYAITFSFYAFKHSFDRIDKHLAVYNNQLEFHIKRTDLIEEELKPLKSSFFKVQGVLGFLGILSVLIGITTALS